jgi:hypothetical protein
LETVVPTTRVALSAAALTAAALVPLAAPGVAGATGPTLTRASVVYVADVNGDFMYGIYGASASSPNTRTAILPESQSRDVLDARVSPDGTKVAATIDEIGNGDYSLDVVDVATGAITHILTVAATNTTDDEIAGFDWSKDGQTLVFGLVHSDAGGQTFTLYTRASDGSSSTSTAVNGGAGMIFPSYSPDGTKFAAVKPGTTYTLNVVDPAAPSATIIGTASSGSFFRQTSWSPDAKSVATSLGSSFAVSTPHADIDLYSVTGASTQTPTTVAAGGTHLFGELPAFAADGSVWFDRWDSGATSSGNADLMQAQLGHSGWVVSDRTNTAGIDEVSPTFMQPTDDGAPASPVTFGAFGLNGTSVVVRWTVPAGLTDYSHVVLHRTNPNLSVTDLDNAIGTSFTDTGLAVGSTYSYTATIVDGAGNSGPTSDPHQVTATNAAKIVAPSPSSSVTPYAAFRVTWGVAGQPAGTTYDVDYAVKGGATWTLGASTHLAQNTTATSGVINGVLGQTYYIRAAVKDTHGNTTITPWTAVNVPYDQKNGQFSTGWVTASNRNFWIGSIAYTAKNGAVFVISPTAKSFSIIGTKCPSCGKFAVYIDGHYRGTISTAYSTTLLRKVLAVYNFTTIGKHQIKLVAVLGTNQRLNIDGVGDLR